MNLLSPKQKLLLEGLIAYKQLTIPQFFMIHKDEFSTQSIRRALDTMYKRRKPLVNRVEFTKISHFGKLSYVYNITQWGLQHYEKVHKTKVEQTVFTPTNPKLGEDYFHRTSTIDFHIKMKLFEKEEGFNVIQCMPYFVIKKSLNSFVSVNKITMRRGKGIIPDLVASIRKNERERVLLFELHNGKDKRRIKEQIKQHALCLTGLCAHKKYKIEESRYYYILLVFEEESVLKAVIKDICNDLWFQEVGQFFLCKTLDQMEDSFLGGWKNLLGDSSEIQI